MLIYDIFLYFFYIMCKNAKNKEKHVNMFLSILYNVFQIQSIIIFVPTCFCKYSSSFDSGTKYRLPILILGNPCNLMNLYAVFLLIPITLATSLVDKYFSIFYAFPVDPNPPPPLSVSDNASTTSKSTDRYGIITNWAIRSCDSIVIHSSVSLCNGTMYSPR